MSKSQFSLLFLAAAVLVMSGCSSKPPEPAAEAPKAAETAPAAAPAADQAIVGEVTQVAADGSSMTVRTSDGQDHQVEVKPDTMVRTIQHGATEAGEATASGAKAVGTEVKKGTMVAVHYTEEGGKMVAREVQGASKETVKQSEVVIEKVEDGGKTVWVKTKDGTLEAYEVSKNATVATGKKVGEAGKVSANAVASGTKATITWTEKAGKKVAHIFQH
jgi:hypothetical protein